MDENDGAPKWATKILLPIAILAAGAGVLFVLSQRQDAPGQTPSKPTAALVETVAVETHDGGLDIEVDGLVVPYREIELSAAVAGTISRKSELCEAGEYVARDTLLVRIDPRDYELEIRRLKKELKQADVMLEELGVEQKNTDALIELAKEELAIQDRQLKRIEKLAGRAVTDSEIDRARHDKLTARNSLLTLRNQTQLITTRRSRLQSGQELVAVRLEKAQLDLGRTNITAPSDGVVVREFIEENSYVQVGEPLVAFEDTSKVEIKCNLRMDQLYWLWQQERRPTTDGSARAEAGYEIPKTPVTVIYQLADREYRWHGVLSRFDGIGLDERTRTAPCRVRVEDPRAVTTDSPKTESQRRRGPPALIRGMYVTVVLHARPRTPLVALPERAVRPGNEVWRVREKKLEIVPIRVAGRAAGRVVIDAGASAIRAGDKIVVSPLAAVYDDMPVEEQTSP